jgi:hypothetical protein
MAMTTKTTDKDKAKRARLVELVKVKTLLLEAPTRRDVIVHVYGIDIGNMPVITGSKKLQNTLVGIHILLLITFVSRR